MTEVLAVVPARGGSKGIPGKNVVDLGGKPLLAWTVDAARASGVVDRLVVSSDDDAILAAASAHGAVVDRRDDALAEDHVHAVHVVLDLLEREGAAGYHPDIVVMLLPTSPFRRSEQITEAVTRFEQGDAPSVISVTELDKQLLHLRTMDDHGRLCAMLPDDQLTAQRQEQPPLYGLNGSIYVARPETVLSARTFHVPGAEGYVMDAVTSVDINEPHDLAHARMLLEAGAMR